MNDNNVKTCKRCQKTLIAEESTSHVCTPYLQGVKEIIIDYSYEIIDTNGDRVINAKGLDDGIFYSLVHCVHNPIHRTISKFAKRNLTRKNPSDSEQNQVFALINSLHKH